MLNSGKTAVQARKTQFGLLLDARDDIVETAVEAEKSGFDVIACGEHVAFHSEQPSSLISLAVAAGVTSSIRLLTAVVILPLYPAALIAKLAAALDVVSNGRLIFGVGVGGEYPAEFAACGVDVRDRAARADEALQLIRLLWTGERVTYDGRFCTLRDIAISPKPLQRPHPPIWVGGRSDAALRRAIEHGQGWFPYMCTPAQLHRGRKIIEAARGERTYTYGVLVTSVIDDDPQAARLQAITWLSHHYRQDFEPLVDKYVVHGDLAGCARRLEEYVSAGADMLVLQRGPGTTLSSLGQLIATVRELESSKQ